ncbi:MAG TPA: DUF4214 domain-containing protein [Pyrinomonadaceae bacterium]|nr:DUF4214 domain-containing protein [Pyrinomonadaceae bacterium]
MNRRTLARESLIFLGFLALTVLMTWPWALHLRDAVSDRGDPYAIAYYLWWDYHQTFHDPFNLFQSTVLYPYKYTLAFTESAYGVSLLFFPLFALGFRPITILSIATLIAFAFSGYGMFRLVRTLTNCLGAAWIAGIVFAFIPYHFQRLPHLHLLFTAWIPLLLEALVLFAAQRSWRRASWLAVTFVMNALTSVTWFILTLIPLTLTGVFLIAWWHLLKDRKFWIRAVTLLGLACLLVIAFLIPYYRVHQLYGLERSPDQVIGLSAWPTHWLAVSERNKLWVGLGASIGRDELLLFPGFLPLLLLVASLLLVSPAARQFTWLTTKIRSFGSFKTLIVLLDCLAVLLLLTCLLTIGYNGIHPKLFGVEIFQSTHATRPFYFFIVIVLLRVLLAPPQFAQRFFEQDYAASIRSNPRTIAYVVALIWTAMGFLGSLGMNFYVHRFLYDTIPLFRSMRTPSRWAMIAYVGLAILAGLGSAQFAELLVRWRPQLRRGLIFATLAVLILFEQRVVPVVFVRGEVDPDPMTLRLKATQMSGGIVELPAERDNYAYFTYTLRAADHGHPVVTAASSFQPPLLQDIEALTSQRPIPARFLDVLEGIPTSYLVVHKALLKPESKSAIETIVKVGVAERRLVLIHRQGEIDTGDELYALTKIEPAAKPDPNPIDEGAYFVRQQYLDLLNREPKQDESDHLVGVINECGGDPACVAQRRSRAPLEVFRSDEFKQTQLLLYGEYVVSFGRRPTYDEWTKKVPLTSTEDLRKQAETLLSKEEQYNSAFVTLCYFNYLKRDPDPQGHDYWLQALKQNSNDYSAVITGFIASGEYRSRFGQP